MPEWLGIGVGYGMFVVLAILIALLWAVPY
jgi:hypothetical protein